MVRLSSSRSSDGSRAFLPRMKGVANDYMEDLTLNTVITHQIKWVLQMTNYNRSQAARILGLPLSTLRSKMKELGIVVATWGEPVYLPLGNDSPLQRGNKPTVGHLT
jgi:DNA-binding protein Fis